MRNALPRGIYKATSRVIVLRAGCRAEVGIAAGWFPHRFHVLDSSPVFQSDTLCETLWRGGGHGFETVIFPSATPAGRQDVLLLANWMQVQPAAAHVSLRWRAPRRQQRLRQ